MASELRRVERALISVSDKTGLVDFARALAALGIELVSTGGTSKALTEAGLAVRDVSDLTGFPELMDGRLKTLHPKVHGGLLAIRENPEHEAAMLAHNIAPIDLLVVNLYPFEATIAKGAPFADCIENIDIGGPAMIRAASKNFNDVTVVIEPEDYAAILAELQGQNGATSLELRRKLAQKAFARTATYDATISNWFAKEIGETTPTYRAFGGRLIEALRYGENPHQAAAFYALPQGRAGVTTARQVQGKALSYNNVNDTDAAFELVAEFDPSKQAAVAIIKHANPCGVAEAASLKEAYLLALRCDPVSAFGGIIALNRKLDAAAAAEIVKIFTEVIIAPDADEEAIALVAAKKNLRLLLTGGLPDPRAETLTFRPVAGGFLVQGRDSAIVDEMEPRVVTKRAPTEAEWRDLKFAFRVAKHVKSNAIVYAKDGATVGIGAGQMSRVDSSRIAAMKAEEAARAAGLPESLAIGSAVASDAFFPFPDGLLAAAAAGATAVIQPGGSVRDNEVIAAADEAGLAMVLTGVRHFRH
ncbi:bifunctional phosphoribosylaminoimidazolecarboxamide formyltransferase/IMP cyclohydrolase [Beijerinckia indica]|uniref:Bifunctional purine biosynthesis protein PurH n=1 Tax=Beijerinckia indica subsp. indica (strain ATCC 9039 / DSM 1715 / NCIMB 8712) TaxID=395963 RepID=B2IJQ6_BEII9|nr:bifunctional phosphoribosylaminoimidazolecarboxamide formyltransferase/IMP cyclohydrolase [Beijerinckia indica]ACB94928.1 phosphoribosylaminoimidazolecarboxamide formyltransferase/IMP cyclohydrolase [Beijerinckia indica subsp. indica ATCC 9039]